MIRNDATPGIDADRQTREARADGGPLCCPPAGILALAQRYFLF